MSMIRKNEPPSPMFRKTQEEVVRRQRPKELKVASLQCRLSVWNAMMGASMLTMPWALKQAGFANGIILLIIMNGLMTYTAYRIITSARLVTDIVEPEFSDVVRVYLGRVAETTTLLCSVVIFLGACIVYWIVMSTSLYHIVIFLYDKIHQGSSNETSFGQYDDVVCRNSMDVSTDLSENFKNAWDESNTVPLYLIILVFPLINIRSPTFFTKFTTVGLLFVAYIVVLVCVKASKWGFHLNFEDPSSAYFIDNFRPTFPALTGVSTMAFFIHSSLMSIMRLQKVPKNNTRDLVIAFSLGCVTYIFIGTLFYVSFPMDKGCVQDNLLENLTSTDLMAFVARIGLFLQLACILPLLVYMMRTQIMLFLFNAAWPSRKHVLILNFLVVAICVLFTVFLPRIGRIISFTGAFCGLSYAIVLPCLIFLVSCHRKGTLTAFKLVFHCILVFAGILNFIAQFIIIG